MPNTESPVISKYERAAGNEMQARIEPYKGREYFSIRQWYPSEKDGGTMLPTRNGLNLPLDEKPEFLRLVVALFPEDVQLIQKEEA
jgi:hypothetical protein